MLDLQITFPSKTLWFSSGLFHQISSLTSRSSIAFKVFPNFDHILQAQVMTQTLRNITHIGLTDT